MGMTDDGKNIVRDFLAGTVPTAPTHVAFGTGSTAFNSSNSYGENIMSLGNYLGNTLSGQQEDNQSLVHEGGDIPKIIYPVEEIELAVDTVITQTDWSASKSFILGHPINGILGSPNLGMGGGQIVLGDDGNSVTTTLVQRRWIWETVTQLEEGTADANIDLQNGDIRLNI